MPLANRDRKREYTGWYFYDWANSAFYTTVVTLFLGPYLTSIARDAAGPDGMLAVLGIPIDPRAYWGYLVSLSVALQVLVLPLAGAAADGAKRKKRLLGAFAYAGALCTAALYFADSGGHIVAGALFIAANLCFGASIVVYNSYLPQIAPPEDQDKVSSRGWGLGYLGGGLLLALNLLLYGNAARLGIAEEHAVRISLCSAGVWWAAFTLIPLRLLRDRPPARAAHENPLRAMRETVRSLREHPDALRFLIAYLLYNDAIQAVIALAAQFGSDELKLSMGSLTTLMLVIQFVAFVGALLFGVLASRTGAKRAILVALTIWSAVLIAMYGWVRTEGHFFAAGVAVGVVLGGSQALSRSLFASLIPRGREAEYFSLYEIGDKGTSWLAPLAFSLAVQFTQSYRLAVLSLIAFFLAGMLALSRVDPRRGAARVNRAGESK